MDQAPVHAISFCPGDLQGIVSSHNDALLITATIANYDIARVFVDTESSTIVYFKGVLDQMDLEGF